MVETKDASNSKNNQAEVKLTESDYESNKIFAGGLTRSTTGEDLKRYFEKFGEVTETEILTDRNTGKSRGFGFVSFASKESVKAVLRQHHKIQGVVVEARLAVKKYKSKILTAHYDQTKRIFIGGVSEKITEEYFRDYFARYGPISSYNYLVDKNTNRPRGYGFVIYETMEDAEKSLGPHPSLGRNCEAKFANPKETSKTKDELENFDYSAYYYAQANLLYSQYLSQMYNGEYENKENKSEEEEPRSKRSRERESGRESTRESRGHRRSEERKRSRRSHSRSRSPSPRQRSRSPRTRSPKSHSQRGHSARSRSPRTRSPRTRSPRSRLPRSRSPRGRSPRSRRHQRR